MYELKIHVEYLINHNNEKQIIYMIISRIIRVFWLFIFHIQLKEILNENIVVFIMYFLC